MKTDFPELNKVTQQIWDQNAEFWDSSMGEGNLWHNTLIAPAAERLLGDVSGQRIVELACGNGQFARRLASLGAEVTACDFSASLLELARKRGAAERIDYRFLDLADESQLATLGVEQYDAAICNMALMDMASITPMLKALRQALKRKGRFVFSIPHPCFNTNGTTMLGERDDYEGDGVLRMSVRVSRYKTLEPQRAIGIVGQPQHHYYFHRPLHVLLGACFDTGFALDGLEEPVFESAGRTFAVRWDNCPEIPPVLVARLCIRE